MIWRCYPFSRHDAGKRNTYGSRSVQPRWGSFTRELLAKMAGEVIAVIGEQVVRRSLKLLRDFLDYIFDFMLGAEGEALQ